MKWKKEMFLKKMRIRLKRLALNNLSVTMSLQLNRGEDKNE